MTGRARRHFTFQESLQGFLAKPAPAGQHVKNQGPFEAKIERQPECELMFFCEFHLMFDGKIMA